MDSRPTLTTIEDQPAPIISPSPCSRPPRNPPKQREPGAKQDRKGEKNTPAGAQIPPHSTPYTARTPPRPIRRPPTTPTSGLT